MANNYIQEGKHLDIEVTEAVESGGIYQVGNFVGIASNTAKPGERISISVWGVYELPKHNPTEAISVGEKLYIKGKANKWLTTKDKGPDDKPHSSIGSATEESIAGEDTVKVKLYGQI